MIKELNATDNWAIYDNKRDTQNPRNVAWRPNLNNAEFSNTVDNINYYTNGFQVSGGSAESGLLNDSTKDYLYFAFAEAEDTTTPTLANSFNIVTYTGDGTTNRGITGVGFKPSLIWNKQYNGSTGHYATDTVNGITKAFRIDTAAAQETHSYYKSMDSDGFTMENNALNANANESFVNFCWKADNDEPTITHGTGYTARNIHVATSDNCSDQGDYIIGTKTYDFKDEVYVKSGFIYSSYAGLRASNVTIQYSDDNTNWNTAYTTTISNNSACGLHNTGNHATESDSAVTAHGAHRFWRYVEGTAITNHHPRSARIGLNVRRTALISANQNAGFSLVKWRGTGQVDTIPHGLGSAPDLIIYHPHDSASSVVGNSESGWGKAMHLDLSNKDNASNLYWNDTAPTSEFFTLGHHSTEYNELNLQHTAYCFRSISGFSKIGSYTGTASSQSITTGFQPGWILTKRLDTQNDNWRMYNSVRGWDKVLYPALSQGEDTNSTGISSVSSTGFTLGTGNLSNASGATYLYIAFKIN
tara:strand:- start:448 stop:2034 length:1587 start_codon:yes stop_codon:yes gene_type:complete